MGKMSDGGLLWTELGDENIKSDTGWRGVSSAWHNSNRDLEAPSTGWDESETRRFRKSVYTDPELSGSSKGHSEDV